LDGNDERREKNKKNKKEEDKQKHSFLGFVFFLFSALSLLFSFVSSVVRFVCFFDFACLFWQRYLVDPASSHMLVSKIKPCMSKYEPLHRKVQMGETANGSLNQQSFI